MDWHIWVLVRLFFNWSMRIYSLFKIRIFSFSVVFVYWCPFVTNFKCSNLPSHYIFFFKCIKLHQILSLFSRINLAYVLEINTFGRDYSNFVEYWDNIWCNKKWTLLALRFIKISYPGCFENLVPKESFAP